jgi:hypothetical protein
VSAVKLPSSGQVTPQGSEDPRADYFTPVLGPSEGPDVPEPLRSRLLVKGYIEIGAGLLGKERYVPADLIVDVSDDVVRLSATEDATLTGLR